MIATDRRVAERIFHDRQAADRAASRLELRFDDAAYLDHESWVRPAFDRLGDVRGLSVLDYGCGHGMAAIVLARRGAIVAAFDLSPGYVAEAQERAHANGVDIECVAADGEALPFASESFDAVWGNAILHHLDLPQAGRELHRVMKPGGIAVFCEPWGGNPLLGFARRWLPYPNKDRTPDERPLARRDLGPLREQFDAVEVEGYQLFGMLRRAMGPTLRTSRVSGRSSALDRLDRRLLQRIPALGNWCRYVVIELRKR